jgi:hypothetical protein
MNTKTMSKILVTLVLLASGLAQAAPGDPGTNYTTPGIGTLIISWLFNR